MINHEKSADKPEPITDLYEQAAAIFAMNGVGISAATKALMQPLLDGGKTFEEHHAWLASKMPGQTS